MPTTVRKRSVVVAGHRTSISLEQAFWEALRDLAALEKKTLNQIVSDVDQGRAGNLSSAIRVTVLTAARAGRLPELPAAAERPTLPPEEPDDA